MDDTVTKQQKIIKYKSYILRNDLLGLIKKVPFEGRASMWFHFGKNVRKYLNDTFTNKWVRRGSFPVHPGQLT